MDTLDVFASSFASSSDARNSEDAMRVLGRVADAFDNPSLHKTDKELLFVVNVRSRRSVTTSLANRESVYRDAPYDSWLDISYDDEDVELVELGNASMWEHTGSSRLYPSHGQRSFLLRGDGTYDVTRMLLRSSPLDRLDRLARMELKKTGWIERADKWSFLEMGLPAPPPVTPRKKASRSAVGDRPGHFSSSKTTSPMSEKPSSRRYDAEGKRSPIGKERGSDTPECQMKSTTPASTRSRAYYSRECDSCQADFSPLSYMDVPSLSYTDMTTLATHTPRRSQTPQPQGRGRLGRAVRNFVKKMLPPSSGGSRNTSDSRSRWTRNTKSTCGESPFGQTWHSETTPRSHVSAGSGWTFGSANSSMDAPGEGCLDYRGTNRWSGFWR